MRLERTINYRGYYVHHFLTKDRHTHYITRHEKFEDADDDKQKWITCDNFAHAHDLIDFFSEVANEIH